VQSPTGTTANERRLVEKPETATENFRLRGLVRRSRMTRSVACTTELMGVCDVTSGASKDLLLDFEIFFCFHHYYFIIIADFSHPLTSFSACTLLVGTYACTVKLPFLQLIVAIGHIGRGGPMLVIAADRQNNKANPVSHFRAQTSH